MTISTAIDNPTVTAEIVQILNVTEELIIHHNHPLLLESSFTQASLRFSTEDEPTGCTTDITAQFGCFVNIVNRRTLTAPSLSYLYINMLIQEKTSQEITYIGKQTVKLLREVKPNYSLTRAFGNCKSLQLWVKAVESSQKHVREITLPQIDSLCSFPWIHPI